MTELRKKDATPLYEQAVRRIRSMIGSGEYPLGCMIPNETELCETFGVSRITVRRAVEELVRQGLLEKKQGKGTYVTSPGPSMDLQEVSSFHEACRRRGSRASTKVIHVKMVPADEKDETDLRIGKGQKVLETLRIRYADDISVMIEKNHFSSVYSYLTEYNLDGSLYNILREFGVNPTKAVHDISITRADSTVSRWLGIAKGDPVLFLEEVIYDQKGRPLHNSRQWIRGDRFTFRI